MITIKRLFFNKLLQGTVVNQATWDIVDSDPTGMLTPTPDGLAVTWSGRVRFDRSGFLKARQKLNMRTYCVDFEVRADHFGCGWDPGVNLVADGGPVQVSCSGLRFVPHGYRGCAQDSLCLFVDSKAMPGAFPVNPPVGYPEWHKAWIEVKDLYTRASVDGHAELAPKKWTPC